MGMGMNLNLNGGWGGRAGVGIIDFGGWVEGGVIFDGLELERVLVRSGHNRFSNDTL